MDRDPVTSSNLCSVGYDEGEMVLEIEFIGGSVYRYSGVPQSVYIGLMGASSAGSYFHRNVKDVFPTIRVH